MKQDYKDDLRELVLELKAEIVDMKRALKKSTTVTLKSYPKPSRISDGKPIGHNFGRTGHIASHCETRQKSENQKTVALWKGP